MALDVYVGQLFTYFNGRWEPEPQLFVTEGEETKAVIIKSNRRSWSTAGIKSLPEVLKAIEEWKTALSEGLGLPTPLEWTENGSEDSEYYTFPLPWAGYEGLLLWAAYDAAGEAPPVHLPDKSYDDPILRKYHQSDGAGSRYSSLLGRTEIWLPGDFSLTFRAPDPTGRKTDFGFTIALGDELVDLNERTWQADFETIRGWSESPLVQDASLEDCARHGFSVLYRLSPVSRREKLPMVLDF